jgi:hypothetical protein
VIHFFISISIFISLCGWLIGVRDAILGLGLSRLIAMAFLDVEMGWNNSLLNNFVVMNAHFPHEMIVQNTC